LRGVEFDLCEIKDKLATSAGANFLSTLDGKVVLPVGTSAHVAKGNTGATFLADVYGTAAQVGTCEACLAAADLPVNYATFTSDSFCHAVPCDDCTRIVNEWLLQRTPGGCTREYPTSCSACVAAGHRSALPAMRICTRCAEAGTPCIRTAVCAVTADCEGFQRKGMDTHEENLRTGFVDHTQAHLLVKPDATHNGKNAKQNVVRWNLVLWGCVISLRLQLLPLFDDPLLRPILLSMGVTRACLDNMDSQDSKAVAQVACFATIVAQYPRITCTVVPEFERFAGGNMPEDIGPLIVDIAWDTLHASFFVVTANRLLATRRPKWSKSVLLHTSPPVWR
jgi:hypothetical protein